MLNNEKIDARLQNLIDLIKDISEKSITIQKDSFEVASQAKLAVKYHKALQLIANHKKYSQLPDSLETVKVISFEVNVAREALKE